MNRAALIIILGFGLSLPACDKGEEATEEAAEPAASGQDATPDAPAPTPAPEALANVDEATKAAADELAKLRDGQLFPDDSLEKSNAKAFLWLAATSENRDEILASLEAIERTWTPSKDDQEAQLVDDDYRAVVRKYLASDDPKVLKAALTAAGNSVRTEAVDDATIDALENILKTHDSVGARYVAIDTIGNLNHDHPRLGPLLLAGMDGSQSDVVVSKSLDRVPFVTSGLAQRQEVMNRTVALLAHENPGVRGNAARTLGDLAADGEHDEVRPKLEALLTDAHPFVRAAALGGLGRLRDPAAIDAIVKLLDDKEKGTYEITGWKTLEGHDGRMHHQGGAWFRVDRMALQTLRDCTWRMGEGAFKHDNIDFKNEDEDIAKAVKQAKAWYKKNRAALAKG